jgi:hypothetical protein
MVQRDERTSRRHWPDAQCHEGGAWNQIPSQPVGNGSTSHTLNTT